VDHARIRRLITLRERTDHSVREVVLNDPAPFVPLVLERRGKQVDHSARSESVDKLRHFVCANHRQAAQDAADREAILGALERQLRKGDETLAGNKGYRRFLKDRR
jgi:hypothetical protein